MFKKVLIIGMIVVGLGWMLPSVVQAAGPPGQGEGREYVIQADDWLSRLAEKYLGDATLWSWIVEATNARATVDPRLDVIEKPNVIYVGQIVFIPTVGPTLSGRVDRSTNPGDGVRTSSRAFRIIAGCTAGDHHQWFNGRVF